MAWNPAAVDTNLIERDDDPKESPRRYGLRVVLGVGRAVRMPRSAVRTDDVEGSVGERGGLRIELQRPSAEGIRGEANEVAGDELALPENDDLGTLGLVVDEKADPRKFAGILACEAADVLGSLQVAAFDVLRLSQ